MDIREILYCRKDIHGKAFHLFQDSLDVIYVHDLQGNFLDANDIALETLGYNREEVKNLCFKDIISKEDLHRVSENTRIFVNKGKVEKHSEYKLIRKDGSLVHLKTHGFPLRKNGKIFAILGIGTVIDKRVQIEKNLIESKEKYRVLFENSPYSIILIDIEGVIIDFNSTTTSLLGYERKDYIGKKLLKLPLFDPKIVPILEARLKIYTKGRRPKRIRLKVKKKDGGFIWVYPHVSLFKVEEENVIQIILEDISQKIKAESLVEKEIEKLKELEKIRKDLISRVSHELKTPLMSITGASELLLSVFRSQLGEDSLELIEVIDRGGKRLNFLVKDLLDISKLEYHKLELKKQKINICKMIEESVRDMKLLLTERDIEIFIEKPEKLVVMIDPIRIEQVCTNLLSNAIKNTPPQGKIWIKILEKQNYVNFIVKDTGIGLTIEEQAQIFNRFSKIERIGAEFEEINIQGSGLGLFISKEIVRLHAGDIHVESEGRHKGSTFVVKLPIK